MRDRETQIVKILIRGFKQILTSLEEIDHSDEDKSNRRRPFDLADMNQRKQLRKHNG